ncbi:MAG: pyridoxamine 5'-phosphate oxidase family protein [Ignavibacteriaceae bacterium]|nr:pyridoxamine 5'-phosphate oxidase family protein [Ignavibacteriaceae bacterium]
MKRITNQIRDLQLIEDELRKTSVGVLALHLDDEKTFQLPTTFLYRDKNVYIFFNDETEFYELIKYNSSASFTIIKEEKAKKIRSLDFIPSYRMFSITINGLVRKVEEEKTIQNLQTDYLSKYCKKSDSTIEDRSALSKAIIMDSDEIHAQEEIGG